MLPKDKQAVVDVEQERRNECEWLQRPSNGNQKVSDRDCIYDRQLSRTFPFDLSTTAT
jgi:hypothetical protein